MPASCKVLHQLRGQTLHSGMCVFGCRERREVILSVRGSMSQRDVLTDFLCFPERVDPTWIRSPAPRSDKATDKATNAAAAPDGDATTPSPSSSVSPDGTGTAPSASPEDGEGHDKSWGGAAAQADEEEEVFAHQGVLSCALAVADDLQRTGVLRAVLECDEEARARLKDPVYQQDCR